MASDLYAALLGEAPNSAEKQAALADLLRRRAGLAEVAQLSGDPTLAPLGARQAQGVNQQAEQIQQAQQQQAGMQARQAQQQAQMQFQQQQEARQAAAQQAQMALTRRGQDLNRQSALENTMARLQEQQNRPAAQPTEDERKAATLGTRLESAMRELETVGLEAQKPGVLERSLENMGMEAAANYVRPEDRQRANAAQRDALDAALTLATGQSYTKEQIEAQRIALFPQLNDGPKQIAAKRERFQTIVDAARARAGRAAPNIDAALGPTKPKRHVKVDAQGNVIGN